MKGLVYILIFIVSIVTIYFFQKQKKTYINLWEEYKYYKNKVLELKEKGDDKAITYLLKAAKVAEKLDRRDIASWQYNNAGYYIISKIEQGKSVSKKQIKKALKYLDKAGKLSLGTSDIQKNEREKKIIKNINYLNQKLKEVSK